VKSDLIKTGSLKGINLLITAGPTWVPIDDVRVISNISSAETGILLAKGLARKKAKVTLFLGPTQKSLIRRNIRLARFVFFDELRHLLIKELKAHKYSIIIHCAAVSDFRPASSVKGKLSSENKHIVLKLLPLPKIIDDIRRLAPDAFLVIFKLETISDSQLIDRARRSLLKHKAQLVVANTLKPKYKAYILNKDKVITSAASKKILAAKLINLLSKTGLR